jgi:hypothetical protein
MVFLSARAHIFFFVFEIENRRRGTSRVAPDIGVVSPGKPPVFATDKTSHHSSHSRRSRQLFKDSDIDENTESFARKFR